jgi:hypothetical protein
MKHVLRGWASLNSFVFRVKKIDMIFGSDNLMTNDAGVQRRQVNDSSITPHPNFNQYTGENDISVITLDKPLNITSS